MACNVTLTGIAYDCGVNLSGVRRVLIADWTNIGADGVTLDTSTGVGGEYISAIDASAGTFKEYIPAKNTGSLTKTLTKDESTGVKYYTNEAVMQFNHMDPAKRAELAELDGGRLVAIVEDMNGKYWYLGKDNFVSATAVTGQTGAGLDDGNFYTLTLTDISSALPYTVLESAVQAVI
jgi:hypothetical protein